MYILYSEEKLGERERELFMIWFALWSSVFQYYGDWYEFERYFFIAETFLKCSAAEYSPLPDDTIRVVNSGKNIM